MMYSRTLFVLGAMMIASSGFASASASELDGVWLRGDGNARVRIASCGSQICATNIWIGDTSGGEAVGDRLVMTLAKEGDGSLVGSAYDSKRGWNISMTIRVAGRSFTSHGCLAGRFICRDVSWTAAR